MKNQIIERREVPQSTDPLGRVSASPQMAVMRRYVVDFINRHDLDVLPDIMVDDYTLDTSGHVITGRDGPYRSAVAQQLKQFPGLAYTPHELFHTGDEVAIRFTEHGASNRHDGRLAAWPSIAIYSIHDGKLARCAIEQDYFSRRRQLATGEPVAIDHPAVAPWDTKASTRNPAAEVVAQAWFESQSYLAQADVQVDDSRATGRIDKILQNTACKWLRLLSGGDQVAFHVVMSGKATADFCSDFPERVGEPVRLHASGLITVRSGKVISGNIIRDRWGLYRQLARA